jgi:hypothetical protein
MVQQACILKLRDSTPQETESSEKVFTVHYGTRAAPQRTFVALILDDWIDDSHPNATKVYLAERHAR